MKQLLMYTTFAWLMFSSCKTQEHAKGHHHKTGKVDKDCNCGHVNWK